MTNPKWHTYAHRKLRKALIPYAIGRPCELCGVVMNRPGVGPKWTSELDLDHVVPRAMGGFDGPKRIVHASCNRSAGSRLGARLRRSRKPPEAPPEWRSRW
jgi:hypothetical protein